MRWILAQTTDYTRFMSRQTPHAWDVQIHPVAVATLMLSALIVFSIYLARNRPVRGWHEMLWMLLWIGSLNGLILMGLFRVAVLSEPN